MYDFSDVLLRRAIWSGCSRGIVLLNFEGTYVILCHVRTYVALTVSTRLFIRYRDCVTLVITPCVLSSPSPPPPRPSLTLIHPTPPHTTPHYSYSHLHWHNQGLPFLTLYSHSHIHVLPLHTTLNYTTLILTQSSFTLSHTHTIRYCLFSMRRPIGILLKKDY